MGVLEPELACFPSNALTKRIVRAHTDVFECPASPALCKSTHKTFSLARELDGHKFRLSIQLKKSHSILRIAIFIPLFVLSAVIIQVN